MEPRKELEKTARRVDQSLTGHSILRDELARLAFVLDLALLVLSAAITFLAFTSDALKEQLLPSVFRGDTPLPTLALLLFIVSVAQWRVGWKEKSAAHEESANALARFKHELSKTLGGTTPITDQILREHLSHYQYVNESITKIPDKNFLRLKKVHKKKMEMSKLLDRYPGASIFLLKIKIFVRDNFGLLLFEQPGSSDDDGDGGR